MARRRRGPANSYIPGPVRDRLLAELERRALRPDLLPSPFAGSLASLTAAWENHAGALDSRPTGPGPRARLLYYALLCQCLWQQASAARRPDLSRWLVPGIALELDWIGELADGLSLGELESAVEHWWQNRAEQPPTDVLREVYEDLIPASLRRRNGEVYTPDWLADHLVEILWDAGQAWLDPSAGSGAFLLALARKRANSAHSGSGAVEFVGIEANPWGSLAAIANAAIAESYLVETSDWNARIGCWDVIAEPAPPSLSPPAPLVGRFTRVIGNPPWVVRDQMDREFVRASRPLWEHYGLLAESGMGSILGGGKKDLAMLVTYVVADRYLRPGGRLGLVVTRSVLKSAKSGRGFRRWRLPGGEALGVFRVDDFTQARPFPGAGTQAAAIYLEKGKATRYPVRYLVWPKRQGHGLDAANSEIKEAVAYPARDDDPLSAWRHEERGTGADPVSALGPCAYRAHLGVNTGGANGVYWLERLEVTPAGPWRMRNLAGTGKRAIQTGEWLLEPEFLYPVLRGKDVRRWTAMPSAWVLLVQDPIRRRGWDEAILARRGPRTLEYLQHFEKELKERAAYRRYFTKPGPGGQPVATGPFYSMFNVAEYSLAPIKVVWNRMGNSLAAAVVTTAEGKPILPQETHCFFATQTIGEAYYLSALLNSPRAQRGLEATGARGGKSFATPSVIEGLALRPFDPQRPDHFRLAELGERASRGDAAEIASELEAFTEAYWRGQG